MVWSSRMWVMAPRLEVRGTILLMAHVKALLNARDQEDPLYDATHGIMFMGVPHRGAPGADYATMVTSIAHLATPLSTNALNQLRKDSKDLLNLSIRFGNIQESLMFVTVMEGESTKLSSWVGRGSLLVSWDEIHAADALY